MATRKRITDESAIETPVINESKDSLTDQQIDSNLMGEEVPEEVQQAIVESVEDSVATSQAKPSGDRQPIFFNNLFTRIQSVDYVYDYPKVMIGRDGKSTKAFVYTHYMKEQQADVFVEFIHLLGVRPSNAGLCIYDEDQKYVFYSSPMLGRFNGVTGVMIGAQGTAADGTKETSCFVPLERKNDQYYLNGVKCSLLIIRNQELQTAVPYLIVKSPNYIFHIGIKYDVKNITAERIDSAFDDGNLDLYVSPFFGLVIPYNKMFQTLFKQNKFPKEGVLMLLEGGTIQRGDFVSSRWKIAMISPSHALLQVQNKDGELFPLEEVEGLYIPSSGQPTKMLEDSDTGTIDRIWLLTTGTHKANRPNHDWIPNHVAVKNVARFDANVQAVFAPMIREFLALPPVADSTANRDDF